MKPVELHRILFFSTIKSVNELFLLFNNYINYQLFNYLLPDLFPVLLPRFHKNMLERSDERKTDESLLSTSFFSLKVKNSQKT